MQKAKVLAPILVCLALLTGSFVRHEGAARGVLSLPKVALENSLACLPLALGRWTGRDTTIDEEGTADDEEKRFAEVLGADEYVRRSYRNRITHGSLHLFVSFYGDRRALVGHYPGVCGPAHGLREESREPVDVPGYGVAKGQTWPADLYRFRKDGDWSAVLSLYNCGGTYTRERETAEKASHEALDEQNTNFLMQTQITLTGRPPKQRVLRTTGRFLSEVLPRLEKLLPEPTREREIKSHE